jgi:S-DNA-T family DNA segregation ATPase FtsK/SpoIIIE
LARALAPLHDAARETGRSIPSHCRLLDVNDLRAPTAAAIGDRWQAGGAPIATIGMGEHGPLRIDLARDGPHALIAGTTGAGKSELLRSIVAGLALNNSPLDLSFVLFDYKGGAAFAECARLPHTAAVITDLDDRLAHRALRSLNAELRRRERLLADSGAGELSDYRAGPGQIMNPLGRLVLVVDEFAALADELPELLGGLIAIAARGRSLGIHLILATQRATGAVSAEMQANLALRIALRLIDPAEALALVGTAAPAAIDKARPGRAFVRLGPTAQEFQTAHLATTITADGGEVRVEFLDDWGRAVRTGPPAGSPGSAGAEHSDLRVLVDSMRAVPLPAGADQRSRPWLSPLDDLLSIDQLAAPPGPQLVAIGLIDLPDEQRQEPLVVDLDRGGSILIAGPAGSGRSLALQTLTAAAARRRSCAELQLFVVDCASHGLDPLAALPHCGAALSDDDPEPIARLLHRLTEEVSRRRAEPNPRDLEAGPALLLLIDGWENLVTALDDYDSGASIEILQTLLRDGPSARLTIAVTGGRASLRHRAVAGVGATYLLGAVSPDIAALVGLPAPARPRGAVSPRTTAPPPPGRAIRVPDGSEVQFAFLGADAGAATQQQVVGEIAAGTSAGAARTSGRRIRIRPLPRRVQRDHLDAGRELQPGEVVLGVGGDAGEPIAVDLFAGDGRWLVAGPPGSGRSSLLAGALTQLHAAGIEVQVAAHPRSQLGEVAARLGIEALAPDGLAPDRPATDRRLAVLIDDVELFTDAAIADALRDLAQLHEPGRGDGSTAVLASGRSDDLANAYQGIAATIRRSRTGVLLRPAPADGALLAVQLPRTRAISPVGRGVLVCDQPQIVQLARGRAALPVQIAL